MAGLLRPLFRRNLSTNSALLKEIEFSAATAGDHGAGVAFWRRLSFFVGLPVVGLCMVNCYLEHQNHSHHDRPEFVKYEHMRVRNKKYPWGDGVRSLFHNPHANALPNGYED